MKITNPLSASYLALGTAALVSISTTLRAEPTPLFVFDFDHVTNDTGEGQGTSSRTITLKESQTHPAPLISQDGEGVTGKPGDFELDLRAASGMGNKGEGGVALVSPAALDSLKSFTLTGWFKCAIPPTNGARLLTMRAINRASSCLSTTASGDFRLMTKAGTRVTFQARRPESGYSLP